MDIGFVHFSPNCGCLANSLLRKYVWQVVLEDHDVDVHSGPIGRAYFCTDPASGLELRGRVLKYLDYNDSRIFNLAGIFLADFIKWEFLIE